jgi:hypothetical protein
LRPVPSTLAVPLRIMGKPRRALTLRKRSISTPSAPLSRVTLKIAPRATEGFATVDPIGIEMEAAAPAPEAVVQPKIVLKLTARVDGSARVKELERD